MEELDEGAVAAEVSVAGDESRLRPQKRRKVCECGAAQPSFGFEDKGLRGARWCAKCPSKPSDAVNVRKKMCECRLSAASIAPAGGTYKDARWCSRCPSKPSGLTRCVSKKICECGQVRPGPWASCLPPPARRAGFHPGRGLCRCNQPAAKRPSLRAGQRELEAAGRRQ